MRRGEKYGVRSPFIATPGHGGPSAAAFTGLKKRDISAAFGVGTGALVKAESYRGRLC